MHDDPLGRQRNGGHDGHSGLDSGLPQRRKQSDLVHRIQPDAFGDLAQESFGGLDHAVVFEV